MAGDDRAWNARLDELERRIGRGRLHASVVIDQVYAKYQHESLDLRHPSGGQALYLSTPLRAGANGYLQDLADSVLEGSRGLDQAMVDVIEELAGRAAALAPVDYNNLRRSAHPSVTSNGATYYDRPAAIPRLTEQELAELRRARAESRRRPRNVRGH